MATSKNIGAEWSAAYAMSIKRLDSQFMLCLLRLMSWPKLGNMHGDLVEDLRLICTLLAKRPMVGFLIARRLKLPVDKTFALLNVLESQGHIYVVGANIMDVNLEVLDTVKTLNAKDTAVTNPAALKTTEKSTATVSTQQLAKPLQAVTENAKPVLKADLSPKSKIELGKTKVEIESSGDVLSRLWRVLNTDIVLSKAARAKIDPKAPIGIEAGDVLSQLWHVLNTDIVAKSDATNQSIVRVSAPSKTDKTTAKKNVKILKDVNGQNILPEKTSEEKAKDVMGQLWSVLNTDIAFKRLSGDDTVAQPSAAKTKEVAEVMSQLWRVLNTEIAANRQAILRDGSSSLSDTTREANDKLSKLWRVLDTEISLKKKPKIYVLMNSPEGVVKKEVADTTDEAVDRLSKLWRVLNSEISIAMPPERRYVVAARR